MAKIGKKRKSKKSEFTPEDEGTYIARVVGSSLDKVSGGKAIVLEFKLKETKAIIKQWYCIQHENSKTEEIAFDNLDNIAFACGLKDYSDSKDFHGIDMEIDVVIEGQYNSIKRFSPIEDKGKSKKKGKKGKGKKGGKNW